MAYSPTDMINQYNLAKDFSQGGQIAAARAQESAAAKAAEASRYSADRGLEQARLAANAQMFPEQQKQQRFNTLLGMIQGGGGVGGRPTGNMNTIGAPSLGGGGSVGLGGGFGGFGVEGGAQNYATAGGTVDPGKPFSRDNPWSPTRMQLEQNAARAEGGRQLGSQLKNMSDRFAARGYGKGSAQEIAAQDQARSANRADTYGRVRDIRNTAEQQRADRSFQYDTLEEQRRAAIGREDVERRTPRFPGEQSDLRKTLLQGLFSLA